VGARTHAHVTRRADSRGGGRRRGPVVGSCRSRSARDGGVAVGEQPAAGCGADGDRCSGARTRRLDGLDVGKGEHGVEGGGENLLLRSRIKNRKRRWVLSRSTSRLRASWVSHAPVGCEVTPQDVYAAGVVLDARNQLQRHRRIMPCWPQQRRTRSVAVHEYRAPTAALDGLAAGRAALERAVGATRPVALPEPIDAPTFHTARGLIAPGPRWAEVVPRSPRRPGRVLDRRSVGRCGQGPAGPCCWAARRHSGPAPRGQPPRSPPPSSSLSHPQGKPRPA